LFATIRIAAKLPEAHPAYFLAGVQARLLFTDLDVATAPPHFD